MDGFHDSYLAEAVALGKLSFDELTKLQTRLLLTFTDIRDVLISPSSGVVTW